MVNSKPTALAGDDVGASVIDCGSWLVRVGAAGDDTPRSLIPPVVGVPPSGDTRVVGDRVFMAPTSCSDITAVHSYDASTGTASVTDWDAMQAVWKAGARTAGVALDSAPVMLVEPTRAWEQKDRASAMEMLFEGCSAPAAYIGRGAAMAAFASARITACVVDVGHQGVTAVPVLDGYALKKSTIRSRIGGRYLTEALCDFAERQLRGDMDNGCATDRQSVQIGSPSSKIRAVHEVRRKRIYSDDASDAHSLRKYDIDDLSIVAPQNSFTDQHRAFYRLRLLDDAKACTFKVSTGVSSTVNKGSNADSSAMVDIDNNDEDKSKTAEKAGAHSSANNKSGDAQTNGSENGSKDDKEGKDNDREKEREREIERSRERELVAHASTMYELPDGNFIDLSQAGASSIADTLFLNGGDDDPTRRAISNMAFDAISACDVDMRRELFGGIILSGGTSLMPGTIERFTRELAILTPQMFKMKIVATQTTIERTAGPWIGGSIVASLGTFQQAWVSKAEYDELGSTGCLRKCP